MLHPISTPLPPAAVLLLIDISSKPEVLTVPLMIDPAMIHGEEMR